MGCQRHVKGCAAALSWQQSRVVMVHAARRAQRLEDMRKHMFKQASIADSAIPHRVYSETKVKPLMQGYGPIVYLLKSCLAVTIEEINQQTTAKILANNFGLGKKAGRRASLLGRVPS